jgi:hypothetical protein
LNTGRGSTVDETALIKALRRVGAELSLVLSGKWPRACVNPAVLEKSKLERWQPRPHRRSSKISDLESADASTAAFPLRPCGPPPP